MHIRLALLLVLTTLDVGGTASEWPQFRGPGGTGVAPDTARPPTRFGSTTNLKWQVAVPPGASSPVIAGNRLFLTGYEKKKLFTLAYDLTTGKELWRQLAPTTTIEPFAPSYGSPANSTPATDGRSLVVYFGSYGLLCYDLDGKERWKHPVKEGMTSAGFGTGSSPILVAGKVILQRDLEPDGYLLCLDLKTGEKLWKIARPGHKTSWSSPCCWDTPSGTQIVVVGGLRLTGYDLARGELVWSVPGLPSQPCTTPLVAGELLVYAGWSYGGTAQGVVPGFDEYLKKAGQTTLGYLTREGADKTDLKGYFDFCDFNKDGKITRDEWDEDVRFRNAGKNVAFALKPGGTGDITATHRIWKADKHGLPYVPSPLVYRGSLYTVNKEGRLSAFDVKTGKEAYVAEQVNLGEGHASPVAANGHLYLCGLNGKVVVVKAGADPARVSMTELDAPITASPAIVGHTLVIRTSKSLYAFAPGN